MSATAVAAAGAAVAYYFYTWRRRKVDAPPGQSTPLETHVRAHREPNNWMEALYFFAEGLRYMYGETLGKWRTADLLIGLAYLARRESDQHPCSDVVRSGTPLGQGLSVEQCQATLDELRIVQRFMKYCLAMRERRPAAKQRMFANIGIMPEDVLKVEPKAGVLRPSYFIIRDRKLQSIVLAVRGTQTIKDAFTNLTGASKPHHVLNEQGLVLGYCHFGMLAAARWIHREAFPLLHKHLAEHPGFSLRVMGHSLGGGTAAMLAMMLREQHPSVTCVTLACPGCMTLELAQSCAAYVTTVINGTDIVPCMSPAAADALREEVMQSSWYEAFRRDLRSSFIVRAVEGSVQHVGSATMWTARATSASFAACYQATPRPPYGTACAPARPSTQPRHAPQDAAELGRGTGRRQGGLEGGLRQRHGGGDDWSAEDAMLIEVAREWAQRHEAMQLDLRLDEAAKPQGGMDRGESSAGPGNPQGGAPGALPAGSLFSRWWWQGCRGQGTSPRSLIERYENEVEEQAVQHEIEAWDSGVATTPPGPTPPLPPNALSMTNDDDDDDEDDGLTEALTDLQQQLNSDLSRVEAAVVAEERIEARRATYPAGRILHLVPAYLLLGEDALFEEYQGPQGPLRASARPEGALSDDEAASRGLEEAGSLSRGGLEEAGSLSRGGLRPEAAGKALQGRRVRYMLLDNVPHECYGRIKLCRTMIQDHFIPSYAKNMDSALHTLIETYVLPQHVADAQQAQHAD